MIPPDVVNSLRTLLPDQQAAALSPKNQPVAAVQRIADVLSNLVPGQRILAEIQSMLPNGTYRATVAQRDVTLALPFAAKPGDSLELEVTESEGKLTLAFVANRGDPALGKGQAASAATTLSNAGKLIGDLMQEINGEGKRAPAAPLNGNQALVSSMPKDAAQLAPILKQALSQSGMFYEAHQARWVAGKIPTEQLRQEPQGKQLPAQPAQIIQPGTQQQAAPPATIPGPPLAPLLTVQSHATITQAAAAPAQPSNTMPHQAGPTPGAQQASPPTSIPAATQNQHAQQGGLVYNLQQLRGTIIQPQNVPHPAIQINSLPTPTQLTQTPLGAGFPPSASPPVSSLPAEPTPGTSVNPGIARPESSPAQSGASPNAPAQLPSNDAETRNNQLPGMPSTQGPDKITNQPPSQGVGIPRDIAPLVQQQLDGLANQNFAWQGQVWPGQKMWWEIGENPEDRNLVGEEADARWHTRLKLILPNLGGVDARLHLQADGELGIRILSNTPEGETRLRDGLSALHKQLEAAGLNVRQILIDHEPAIET